MFDLGALNPQQRLAVQTTAGPVLILAGAGTGKTRVITCRIAYLIERGVAPGHLLAVTFTNKAAREMLERVHRMLPQTRRPAHSPSPAGQSTRLLPLDPPTKSAFSPQPAPPLPAKERTAPNPPRPTICTFHALGVRLLRQHIDRLGYKKNFVIYNESDQLALVKKILSHISARGEKVDPSAVLALLSRIKIEGASAAAFADPSVAAMASHIRARYESALRACNAVDFDDLLLLTLRLLEEHPDVLAACRDRFRYVMVDEYQDTNAAQFHLVHLLTREHRNLCVVGDDDQSIYGWRGARIANLLDLEQHFPDVKVIKLEQNYRSTNVILRAANALIKNNARRRGKQLWSQKGQGARIALHTFANDTEEARGIVEQIEYARLARRARWADHAVLFRTNQQSRPLETVLRQAGVRYHLIGGQSYFDRREVKDFLAYLKVFANPHDDASLLRIANVPPRGLSDATLQRCIAASQERQTSVNGVLRHPDVLAAFPPRARESLGTFVALIERTRAPLLDQPPISLGCWAEGFLAETGYLEDLRRSEKDADTAENRVRNVQALVADLESFDPEASVPTTVTGTNVSSPRPSPPLAAEERVPEGRERRCLGSPPTSRTESNTRLAKDRAGFLECLPGPQPLARLQAFLDQLMLDTDREGEDETPGDAVTLITMHSCKGLEFPQVWIVGLEEGLLPHSRSKAEGTLEEERRLFYVAITRAQETLALSHCLTRKKYGKDTPCHPSSFLRELPPELVEVIDDKSRQPVSVDTGKPHFAALRAAIG